MKARINQWLCLY